MAHYRHTFTWQGDAQEVIVTGTFDKWSSSLYLSRVGAESWEASAELPFGVRVLYKFVVDGVWRHSGSAPIDVGDTGYINNVLHTPALYYPAIPSAEPLHLSSAKSRDFEVVRWDGRRLDVIAGAHTGPSLHFACLRRLLDLVLLVHGGYRFGRLNTKGSSTPRNTYHIDLVDGDTSEDVLVQPGFFLLLQPEHTPHPTPRPPLVSHLFSTAPSSSASASASTESFSTALDTSSSFSASGFSRASGDFVRVLEVAKCWSLGGAAEESGFSVTKVKQAWFAGKIVFDPHNHHLPLSLHPSTIPLLAPGGLRYIAPISPQERKEMEVYLLEHYVESVEQWVKGVAEDEEEEEEGMMWGSVSAGSGDGAGSEWGEEVVG